MKRNHSIYIEKEMISVFKSILKLMDIKTLVAGISPVILGSIYSEFAYGKINVLYLILLIIAIVLVQSATNMINDYFDFKRGADNENKKDEKELATGKISPKQVLKIIASFLFVALIIGIFLASQTSYNILIVAFIGIIIAVLYSFGPLPISYMPIGEIVAGLTMGIGITTTVIYIHSAVLNSITVLVAIPTALFIATILLSNNLSDLEVDRNVGRKTLPILIGIKNTEFLWVFNVIMLLVSTFIFVLIDIYPISVMITVFLLFPYSYIRHFLSCEKSIYTKIKIMGIISLFGIRYHISIFIGLIFAIIY